MHQRQGEVEPPPHAAGVGTDPPVGRRGEVDPLEELHRARPPDRPREAVEHRLEVQRSRPVMYGSMAASCSATPMLRRTAAASATTSCPATRARPPVGRKSVASMRTVVLLPAPLGPRNP